MDTVPHSTEADQTVPTQLADTLCARLCHDISSPLGTLIGALELMTEDAALVTEALPLASETAAALGLRLRLLRAAWTADCGPLGPAQIAAFAAGLPGRVRVDLSGLQGPEYEAPVARVLLNLLLLGAEALPRGGVVSLSGEPGGDVMVTVAGPSAAWPASLPPALLDLAAVPFDDPRALQSPLAVLLARAAGLRLSLLMNGGGAAAPPLLMVLD